MAKTFRDGLFYLDWSRQNILGWEKKKSRQAVESIIRGIELGDEFPEVFVYQINETDFSIVGANYVRAKNRAIKDGGHTRSKAHSIVNKPLLCRKVKNRPYVMPGYFDPYGTINIQDIILVDDLQAFLAKKELFPNYRDIS